jgi:acyl dehydratase
MGEKDELLEVMKEWVGQEQGPFTCEVEKGMMMKLPWAVDDPNPLWRDEHYARQTRWGGLIASPYFAEFLRFRGISDYGGPATPPAPRRPLPGSPANVVGGEEVEFFQPIRPGDVITINRHTAEVKKRWSSSLGREVVIETLEQVFTNQYGEVVATHKSTNFKI